MAEWNWARFSIRRCEFDWGCWQRARDTRFKVIEDEKNILALLPVSLFFRLVDLKSWINKLEFGAGLAEESERA